MELSLPSTSTSKRNIHGNALHLIGYARCLLRATQTERKYHEGSITNELSE